MCRAYHFGDGDGERERDTILFTCDIPSAGVMASGPKGSEAAKSQGNAQEAIPPGKPAELDAESLAGVHRAGLCG